ncbi:hypothetical protein H2200_009833 [Cladophialophora chaetospira]|uniref:Major facilitator superfamily (MFS) profile domain-containing protein n=1 Tax=Cladophialophora chaetospira TaxID=386627 RepID=A0AA38X361_9EURO|nr:hypothetical protein H2200_009833 [Cladophialophora chaetospira]
MAFDSGKASSASHMEVESVPAAVGTQDADIHEYDEKEGYVVDVGKSDRNDLKLAKDGHTILVPQPSNDPRDPLNWSPLRKGLFLAILSATALLPEFCSATGAAALFPQSIAWGITPDHVNHSQAGNVFMLGPGSVAAVTLSSYFGRAPVLFWFLIMASVTAGWAAGAGSFESFMAARILNGFFASVASGGGLMYINDLFFFHERARKINILFAPLLFAPMAGPLFAFFELTSQPWRVPFWICFAMIGSCLMAVVLFLDETYYDRRIPIGEQPERKSRILRLIGTEQFRSRHLRNSFGGSLLRPLKVLAKPTTILSTLYNMLTFSWVVGIVNTLGIFLTPEYHFGLKQLGFFFFSPVVGTLAGAIVGHWLHDKVARRYIQRHDGHFEPEARLTAIWMATPLLVVGLVLLGFALEDKYHYMVVAVSWGLFSAGIMILTVALNAYNLDCYPEASGEVSAWLIVGRTLGGFIISYEQIPWAAKDGAKTTFTIQAALCVVGMLLMIGVQHFGKRMRSWAGKLDFQTI